MLFNIMVGEVVKTDKKFLLLPAALIIIPLLSAVLMTAYFYHKYNSARRELSLLQSEYKKLKILSSNDAEYFAQKVSELMEVPQGEKPTVVNIQDFNKLQNQAKFAKTNKNYKVLLYMKAKKAILYDPENHRIVDVLNISSQNNKKSRVLSAETSNQTSSPTPTATPSPREEISFAIRRGSGTRSAELAESIENKITQNFPKATILVKETKPDKIYTSNILVDLKGDKKLQAELIAQKLGIQKSQLPAGEDKPDTDFLVIIGK